MRDLATGLVLALFRRYHLAMRLESFSVEELTLMVDALLDFIRRYTARRKSDDAATQLSRSWCDGATVTAKKLWPILRQAETKPLAGIALEGASQVMIPTEEQQPPQETRVVLLTIDDLKYLERAIEPYTVLLSGRGTGRDRPKNLRLAKVCKKLLGRVGRMHARARRSASMSIATP